MSLQYADPDVSRTKFDREIAEYRQLAEQYRRRGCFLVRAEFPAVLVVLATAMTKPAVLVMGVAFDYSNYDAAPPSVRIVNPFSGEPYKLKDIPSQLPRLIPQQQVAVPGLPPGGRLMLEVAQPYMQAHDAEEVPFLCLAGVREYHEHPAHSGDLWELHRKSGAGRLVRLLEVIDRYGVAPIVGFNVQLVPQVALNYGPPQA